MASYQRAAEIVARAAPPDDPWVKTQLAELAQRLEGLGARLDAAGLRPPMSADPETVMAAPPPSAPVPVSRVRRPAAQAAPPMDPMEFEDLARQLARVQVIAEQARLNVADLRQRLEGSGQVLRADISAGVSRAEAFLEAAASDLERRDGASVRDNLQRAAYAWRLVGKAVGR